jgi:hypothetical protein
VVHANGAFRMLTKARRELAFGRKGHCKSPSTAAFLTSCSLIVPSNNILRDETEFNTTGVGRGRRVSRVLQLPVQQGISNTERPLATPKNTRRVGTKWVLVPKTYSPPNPVSA